MRTIGMIAVAVSLTLVVAPRAFADVEAPPPPSPKPAAPPPGWGEKEAFAFTIENVLGFASESLSQEQEGQSYSNSVDSKGFFPGFFGPSIGLHAITASHITWGANVSFWHARPFGTLSGESKITAFGFAPRIGYAGTFPKAESFGYWFRGGFDFYILDATSGGFEGSESTSTFFDLGLDAFGVIHPVEHFAVLLGPRIDIALAGHSSENGGSTEKFNGVSFFLGFMGDL